MILQKFFGYKLLTYYVCVQSWGVVEQAGDNGLGDPWADGQQDGG